MNAPTPLDLITKSVHELIASGSPLSNVTEDDLKQMLPTFLDLIGDSPMQTTLYSPGPFTIWAGTYNHSIDSTPEGHNRINVSSIGIINKHASPCIRRYTQQNFTYTEQS